MTGLIHSAGPGSGDAPRVAFDASGNAIAIWAQGSSLSNIWSNRYTAGVGWGTAVQIENNSAGSAALPQVAVYPAGDAVAVWYQFNGASYDVWVNRYKLGAGWGTPALLETLAGHALRPQIAVGAVGAVAVWDQFDGTRISIWASEYR